MEYELAAVLRPCAGLQTQVYGFMPTHTHMNIYEFLQVMRVMTIYVYIYIYMQACQEVEDEHTAP